MSLALNRLCLVLPPWSVQIQVWYLVLNKYLAFVLYESPPQRVVNSVNFGVRGILRHHILGPFLIFRNFLSYCPFSQLLPQQLSYDDFIREAGVLFLLDCSSIPSVHVHCPLEMHLVFTPSLFHSLPPSPPLPLSLSFPLSLPLLSLFLPLS